MEWECYVFFYVFVIFSFCKAVASQLIAIYFIQGQKIQGYLQIITKRKRALFKQKIDPLPYISGF